METLHRTSNEFALLLAGGWEDLTNKSLLSYSINGINYLSIEYCVVFVQSF